MIVHKEEASSMLNDFTEFRPTHSKAITVRECQGMSVAPCAVAEVIGNGV